RVDRRRQATEWRLALLAALGPALMALPLAGMGWLMTVRVLQPVGRLQQTMARVEAGDLGARLTTSRHDEIGDLKRAFTRMTESLQASTTRLADNEQRLRLITDHLPARVSHYLMDDRCTFANRPFCEAWGHRDESEVLGRTMAELLPAPLHAALQPWTAAAKTGVAQFFLVSVPSGQGRRHHEFAMVPDRAADGTVQGLYVMAREVTERVEAEARIEAALHEKEVLLKEVHHRVKNNMQIVSSLLQLQSGATESEAVRMQLAESQDRIRSMALIHEKLYEHHDFARIDFADYLHGLLAVLAAAHGRGQRLEVHAESLWLGIDQAVPAGLILNELVTNSWKHGFPDGRSGRIEVRFEALEGKRVRLSVADDGVGVAPGFQPAAHSSLGLRLVHLLAEQLDAELHFGAGPGFSCSLSFERQSLLPSGASHG
ncbi:MAG TPA: histidine kinase dimerization/phosphoacceptor domain -containing protein, partial [Methylibium sp.]|nr:histidine kinase dimerization/phosphoacceptor domain -containing protein [Methylibium sp.]